MPREPLFTSESVPCPHTAKGGFVAGTTWVLCAHRRAFPASEPGGEERPGVFTVFRPTHVDYVVRGDETDEELERLVARGVRPVRVQPARGSLGEAA